MFGSISNWINTNVPQVNMPSMPNMPNISMPTMPNMPNMPNISMPSMPNMPNISMPNMPNMPNLFNKNKDEATGDQEQAKIEAAIAQAGAEEDATAAPQAASNGQANVDAIQVEPQQQAGAVANVAEGGENKKNFNPLDLDPSKALGTAKDLGSNFGNMLFSIGKKASSNVMTTATHLKDVIEKKTFIGDFTNENEKFVNEKKVQQRREDAALPPWVGYHEEDILKDQILELSQDSRNFLRSPPPGVDYQFDFNLSYPVALVTLEEDKNLKDMRFKLVPKHINEESFWRNYFYRVSLIKQSTQLGQLSNDNPNSNSNDDLNDDEKEKHDSVSSMPNQGGQNETMGANEFVSDSYDQDVLNDEEIQSELKQLKLDNNNKKTDDLEDWDKGLPEDIDSISAEELEKEINQMIGK